MCPPHTLLHLGNRDVKVQTKGENDAGDKDDKNGKRGVFEIRDLDFHGTEFDTPAYVGTWGWGFEAHVLPVRGLEVFEMVVVYGVVLVY